MHRPKFAGDRVTLGLRASIIVLDIIAFSFLLNALSVRARYYYMDETATLVYRLALTPVVFSLVWTAVSLLLNFFKGAYHPGVDIGMELCSWAVVASIIWCLIMWLGMGRPDYASCDASYNEECTASLSGLLLASEIIAAVTIVVCGMLHFTLFFRACRETHMRRRMEREARLAASEPHELLEHVVVITHSKHDYA